MEDVISRTLQIPKDLRVKDKMKTRKMQKRKKKSQKFRKQRKKSQKLKIDRAVRIEPIKI